MKTRLNLLCTLKVLLDLDESLPHEKDAVWSVEDSTLRNRLVWHAASLALELGFDAYISPEELWPVIYINLPPGQISYHVPSGDYRFTGIAYRIPVKIDAHTTWDGHSRETKNEYVRQYIEEVIS